MKPKFDWKVVGSEAIDNNPPIPLWECMIGKDINGEIWLCQVRYSSLERRFMVIFDKDIPTGDGKPFLRHEVVYSDNFWGSMRDYHKMAFCKYEDIQNVIARFINENKLT